MKSYQSNFFDYSPQKLIKYIDYVNINIRIISTKLSTMSLSFITYVDKQLTERLS